MGAGDGDAGAVCLHHAQRLGVADHVDAALPGGQQLGMVVGNRGGSDDQVAAVGQGVCRLLVADGDALGV